MPSGKMRTRSCRLADTDTCRGQVACGCSLYCMRLQPLLHTVAASTAYGCSLCRAWLPVAGETEHVVAASTGYGGVRCVTCSCRSSVVEVAGSGGAAQKMVMFS